MEGMDVVAEMVLGEDTIEGRLSIKPRMMGALCSILRMQPEGHYPTSLNGESLSTGNRES